MSARVNVLLRHANSRASLRLPQANTVARQWQNPAARRRPAAVHARFESTSATSSTASASTTATSSASAASAATAATASAAANEARSAGSRLKNAFLGTTLLLLGTAGYLYGTDTRASAHRYLAMPLIRAVCPDGEDAHNVTVQALETLYQFGVHPRERGDPDAAGDLRVTVFGHTLDNPVGISAGLDKNAQVPDPLFALGPAVVEVGGITPKPQEGNPKPRVFRVVSQEGLINRYGLNSEGADSVAARLRNRVREFAYAAGFGLGADAEQRVLDGGAGVPPGSLTPGKIMAVQVAKNKTTPDGDIEAVKNDYVYCVDRLARYADVIVVNVSSPNTPGLRSLQAVEPLTRILTGVVGAARAVDRKTKPAVMVKVSPDEESDEEMAGICDAVWESGVDGVIVGNTTKRRPAPLPRGYVLPPHEQETLMETGGYSGPQMFERTLGLVARYRKMLDQGPRIEAKPVEEPKAIGGAETGESPETSIVEKIEAAASSNESAPSTPATTPSPQLHLPDASEPFSSNPDDLAESGPSVTAPPPSSTVTATSAVEAKTDRSPYSSAPKEIWATGGVTNGQQALELLNAGASIAMIYTTMVYNGSGTVTRIKNEMREEIQKKK